MELNIKDNGSMIKQMEKEYYGIITGINTKGILWIKRQVVLEYIFIKMAWNIKEIGNKIYSKDMVKKHGLMVQNIAVTLIKAKEMGMDLTKQKTKQNTKVNGKMVK